MLSVMGRDIKFEIVREGRVDLGRVSLQRSCKVETQICINPLFNLLQNLLQNDFQPVVAIWSSADAGHGSCKKSSAK